MSDNGDAIASIYESMAMARNGTSDSHCILVYSPWEPILKPLWWTHISALLRAFRAPELVLGAQKTPTILGLVNVNVAGS